MSTASKPLWKRWKRRATTSLAGTLGPWIFRLLAATWRVRRDGRGVDEFEHEGTRLPVFALWHRHIPAGFGLHRNRNLAVMISRHHDGEIVARIVEGLGYATARGSSYEGSLGATREMLRMARDAKGLVLTPDGPRGPAGSIAPGVLYLAAASKQPLVVTFFESSRAWRFGSWDRMEIPKPFARIVVAHRSISVSREDLRSEEGVRRQQDALHEEFRLAGERAQRLLEEWSRE